jgi:hypothetical protein
LTELPQFWVEEGQWAIARLPPDAPIPEWAQSAVFSCLTRTRDELSIVCPESAVPEGVRREGGWAMLKLAGPFPFTEVGILSAFLAPLAAAAVSIFAISTFDTDYVLVRRTDLGRAVEALESARRRNPKLPGGAGA